MCLANRTVSVTNHPAGFVGQVARGANLQQHCPLAKEPVPDTVPVFVWYCHQRGTSWQQQRDR
jgi:hypothetical protein